MKKYPTSEHGRFAVIALNGEVDLNESPRAREQILSELRSGRPLLIDLSAVDYIDSSGVASLVEGFQLARSQQQEFGLVGVSKAAMQVLQLARLDKVFPIYASLDECN
jgi:anti-sigma B factor antagonist